MEVLYHISGHIFVEVFACIGLKNRPNIYGIGTSNQSDPENPIDFAMAIVVFQKPPPTMAFGEIIRHPSPMRRLLSLLNGSI